MEWIYIVVVISVLLALSLILKEVKRKERKNLAARLGASVVAIIALTLIALPPSYYQTRVVNDGRTIVLLTEGFHKDSLWAFTEPLVISTDLNLLKASGAKDQVHIPAIDYYLAENPNVQTLHILGNGLPDEELKMLHNKTVHFYERGEISGFQKVTWENNINTGEELLVSGSFSNSLGEDVKIQLIGLGSVLDSAIISPDSKANFQLICVPRQLGPAMDYLVATSGKDTLFTERIPFEVNPEKPLQILIFSSSPDFEVSFLKQWLAVNNFSVAVRSMISQGKFSTEFLNMDEGPISIQAGMLERFDVLITDETSLNQLSSTERQVLNAQVNNGLGLVIRDEEEVKQLLYGGSFQVMSLAGRENRSVQIPGTNFQISRASGGSYFLAPQAHDQPLAWDNANRVLVTSRSSGLGKIIFSTLNNTYFLQLSGKSTDYSAYWSYLIEKAARKSRTAEQVYLAEQFPVVHQKTNVLLQTERSGIPEVSAGGSGISLEQDERLPYRWTGSFWPDTTGWITLETASGSKNQVYVYSETDWRSTRKAAQLNATRHFAKRSKIAKSDAGVQEKKLKQEVPPIFFYLLLLICCSYLWIETKFL